MVAITLTGADERTDLPGLAVLADRPGVEIGLLLSLSNTANRYPGAEWLQRAVALLGSRCAVHVCGRVARAAALEGLLPWLRDAGRIQVNGAVDEWTLRTLTARFRVALGPGEHQLLVDASGGLGPDNLAEELARIANFAREPWWLDMETKLRRDDLRDKWATARAA